MPKQKTIKLEPTPKELWLFRDKDNGNWVRAVDDPPGGEAFLACFSEQDAKATVEHQMDLYSIDCTAVKVWSRKGA